MRAIGEKLVEARANQDKTKKKWFNSVIQLFLSFIYSEFYSNT